MSATSYLVAWLRPLNNPSGYPWIIPNAESIFTASLAQWSSGRSEKGLANTGSAIPMIIMTLTSMARSLFINLFPPRVDA